jgi:hypothetical protein
MSAVIALVGLAPFVAAQEEPRALIEKAIKAHGGEAKLAKIKAIRAKAKGTVETMGGLPFTSESSANLTGLFKEAAEVDINGQKIVVTNVYDGKKCWTNVMGMTIELDEKLVAGMKDAAHVLRVNFLVCLREKEYQLTSLGEIKVNGRPALGVKIKREGYKDINLYFDKENGLLVKTDHRGIDFMTGQEVDEESIVSDFTESDGYKWAKKLVTLHDGKKYVEAEISEFKLLDQPIDEAEFSKP